MRRRKDGKNELQHPAEAKYHPTQTTIIIRRPTVFGT